MNDILAVYRGPLKNRYDFTRGATYLLKTRQVNKVGVGITMIIPHSLDGEVLAGPLYYWNHIDLTENWIPMDFYDEEAERKLKEETSEMIERLNNRIRFKFKEEK